MSFDPGCHPGCSCHPVEPAERCSHCGEWDFECDCMFCANVRCGVHLTTAGAWGASRLEPAVVCCSTECLLDLGQRKRLKVTQGSTAFTGGRAP